MTNRRGESKTWITSFIALGVLIFFTFLVINLSEEVEFGDITNNFRQKESKGFEEIYNEPGKGPLVVLNYIFGRIPGHLVTMIGGSDSDARPILNSAIVIIAIWFVFFFIFGDIMKLFGGFTPSVNWTVAGLLTLIGANIQVVSFVIVYFLSILSIFGSLAVLASIALIFVLFVLFHFGSSGVRAFVIKRRAEDAAIRAVAGGKKAASGIHVLKEIVDAANKGE